MLMAADNKVFFKAPDSICRQYSEIRPVNSYPELKKFFINILGTE
jgi:hypothetical protein